MADIEKLLREAGYKYTTPRRVVARVLESHHAAHLSANEVWEAVKAVDQSIGRMSVYRTLDLFTRIGYIRPASQSAYDARNGVVYVIMHDGHHHHIICQRCNRLIEFDDCGLDQLIAHLEATYNCVINGHLLEFFGLCSNCRAEEQSCYE